MKSLQRTVFMLCLSTSLTFGICSQSIALNGGEVAGDCANYPETPRKNLCEFWVSELVEIVRSDDELRNPLGRLCPPADVALAEHIALVNAWLAAHPELHRQRAYKAAYGAFRQKFPCR